MKKGLALIILLLISTISYSKGLQLNLGMDVWREVSDVPGPEDSKSMNQGYTIGGEYIWDYNERFHYGLGGEFRSRLKGSGYSLNDSIPLYLVGKYDILNHQLYLVGRVGYNMIGASGYKGGHYVAGGIGKEIGLLDIEVLYENMGYTVKEDDTNGNHQSVGIKLGFRLADIYDAITKSRESKEIEPEVSEAPIPVETKPEVIYKDKIVKVYVVRGGTSRFAFDQASLTKDEKIQLDNMKKKGLFEGAKEVIITGHTDKSGPAEYNKRLSVRRAQAVQRELDLPEGTKVTIIGKGESEPLGGSPALDRRVEIDVIK